jgi:hypothetical protein
MALLSPDQNPTIADTILFQILTPGSDGCPPADAGVNNTYKVTRVTIYFVARDFTVPSSDDQSYNFPSVDPTLQAASDAASLIACENPTTANIAAAAQAKAFAAASVTTTPFYFNEAVPVSVFGNDDYPAWLRTDPDDSFLVPAVDDNGDLIPGQFTLEWTPSGEAREGDYFICWTWTPNPAGDELSVHQPFYLIGDTIITTALPTHYTVPGKYQELLKRYLPEMFDRYLGKGDLTPDVLDKFHMALAKAFTDIENLANQVIDLLDANVTQEALLPYLSNLFNLKLRSQDSTLWRRQIKNAVPLFKQKGTLNGLSVALAQAGITLSKYTNLYQVVSLYTHTDMFYVTDNSDTSFILSRPFLGPDVNLVLQYRKAGMTTFTNLTATSYLSFASTGGPTTATWVGATASTKIILGMGDLLTIRYNYATIPGSPQQTLENYLQTLDLADQRDPLNNGNLVIPLKNWNVFLIEQDDPMFAILVPQIHAFQDDVIFGKVRTEFGYSENIYNMDEYNGSTRDSTDACDIDGNFLDSCGNCQSSKFNLDLEIQDLSNDSIKETNDIIAEYAPFHAILNHAHISGGINEFMTPPVESVETLIMFMIEENVIAGNANNLFARYRNNNYTFNGVANSQIKRDVLAISETVVSSQSGTAFNSSITLFCPDVRFDSATIGVNTYVEVLAPSPNAGTYLTIANPTKHTVEVASVAEPLNQSAFTFRLSNVVYRNPSASINQDDLFELGDASVDYGILGLVTSWDIFNGSQGSASTVSIPAYGTFFTVADISPDGNLLLADPNKLLPTAGASSVVYTVQTMTSSTGVITCKRRGRVTLSDVNVPDIRGLAALGQYARYVGIDYLITGFVSGSTDQIYIEGYSGGNAGGVSVTIHQRYIDNQIGYFNYKGLMLDAGTNLESSLNIQDGSNPPAVPLENDSFMSNFLILIDTIYYKILGINQNIVTIGGPFADYKTIGAGGTPITYSVIQMIKNYLNNVINIDGNNFIFIDRRGNDMAFREPIQYQIGMNELGALGVSTDNQIGVQAHDVPSANIGATATDQDTVTAIMYRDIQSGAIASDQENGVQNVSQFFAMDAQSTMSGASDGDTLSALAVSAFNDPDGNIIQENSHIKESVSISVEYKKENE